MILAYFVPIVVVLMMCIVGTGLSAEQFRLIARTPGKIIISSVLALVLLPFGALIIGKLFASTPEMAAGLVLIAACPGGALSNYYCYLVRSSAALSVTLTGLSSLHAFLTLPLLLGLLLPQIAATSELQIPYGLMVQRLLLLLILPILVGMLIRHFRSQLIERSTLHLRIFSMLLLITLLAAILLPQWHKAQTMLSDVLLLGIIFTSFAMLIGWAVGKLLRMKDGERMVLPIEYAIHNLGIAAIISAICFDRPEFLTFAALFVVLQFGLIATGLVLFKLMSRKERCLGL